MQTRFYDLLARRRLGFELAADLRPPRHSVPSDFDDAGRRILHQLRPPPGPDLPQDTPWSTARLRRIDGPDARPTLSPTRHPPRPSLLLDDAGRRAAGGRRRPLERGLDRQLARRARRLDRAAGRAPTGRLAAGRARSLAASPTAAGSLRGCSRCSLPATSSGLAPVCSSSPFAPSGAPWRSPSSPPLGWGSAAATGLGAAGRLTRARRGRRPAPKSPSGRLRRSSCSSAGSTRTPGTRSGAARSRWSSPTSTLRCGAPTSRPMTLVRRRLHQLLLLRPLPGRLLHQADRHPGRDRLQPRPADRDGPDGLRRLLGRRRPRTDPTAWSAAAIAVPGQRCLIVLIGNLASLLPLAQSWPHVRRIRPLDLGPAAGPSRTRSPNSPTSPASTPISTPTASPCRSRSPAIALGYALARDRRRLAALLTAPPSLGAGSDGLPLGLLVLALGSLAATNAWDLPIYGALAAASLLMATSAVRGLPARILLTALLVWLLAVGSLSPLPAVPPPLRRPLQLAGAGARVPTPFDQFIGHLGGEYIGDRHAGSGRPPPAPPSHADRPAAAAAHPRCWG